MALSLRSWVANDGWARLVLVSPVVGGKCGSFLEDFHDILLWATVQLPPSDAGAGAMCESGLSYSFESELLPGAAAYVQDCPHLPQGKKTVVHVSAHLINAVSFSVRFSDDFPSLNMAQHRGQDPRIIILTTVPGITGVLLVLILFLMFTASSNYIRLSSYEIFFYTHNLFIIFYIILMLHVVGGALKYQSNVDMHPPGCLQSNHTSLSDGVGDNQKDSSLGATETFCREEARFSPHFPVTWLWVSAPLCLYCAERLCRYVQSSIPVTIVSVVKHPCDVIEVCMMKNGFKARPGQYILLSCSSVSSFESHPFTLTKCPTKKKETFCVHLRVVGDWTELLTHQLLTEFSQSEVLPMVHQTRYPKLLVDGPFGSPSEEVFNYKISVCVAGGIGVTPFACILHALLDGWMQYKLRRLYFVWACKDLQSFYWFADLLCTLHNKLWEENRPDYLNIQLYLSTQTEFQHLCEERYKPLSSRLRIGRPQWELLFDEIGRSNNHKRIGVFCCGPKGMSRALHSLCNSNPHPGVTFEFNTESFI
ncbi:NADPH oxidase 4 isoform X3 [Denticeps clupeoides]|uniref:NADPH oxidase 4 isoform X3 n=1 Tax=Denticeps clupeoides TaxID=299321 RepID=UPI0010A4CC86|nr:NADPH oxidase 4 isoform X3 [Denticeps clupeoides]